MWKLLLLFSHSVVSLQPHGLQHARLPCPSLFSGVCSNSCALNQWCHPIISSSATLFSCFSLSQHQGLFQWVGSLHHVATITRGNSLVVQWLGLHAFTAKGPGPFLGWGAKIPWLPCIAEQILNHWTTREVPVLNLEGCVGINQWRGRKKGRAFCTWGLKLEPQICSVHWEGA